MNTQNNFNQSKRLTRKAALFKILKSDPALTAAQLQKRAREANIDLSKIAAHRAIRAFRDSGGSLENSESRCFQTIASILQNAIAGEHLTAAQILEKTKVAADNQIAVAQGWPPASIHLATVYRVLSRLHSIGLVTAIESHGQKLYEWRREESEHGHLTCIICGDTIEFEHDYLDSLGRQISTRLGYQFLRIEFLLRALCLNCRQLS